MAMSSVAKISGIVATMLLIAAGFAIFSSRHISSDGSSTAAGSELLDSITWGEDSSLNAELPSLPDLVNGWNTSVGTAGQRAEAAKFFGVTVSQDPEVWLENDMTPFVGRTMKMTGIDILKRNPFNTVIEIAVKEGTVLWTIEPGPLGTSGAWVEHIDGKYTGVAHTAGYVSRGAWLEEDNKSLLGHKIENDWGLVEVKSVSNTTVVLKYWSYKKAKFIMTWTLLP
eukprot:TRINITY_DN1139_c0_g1_i3.p1 TRINITY_DN1139_c0_g1~~TRINITY_DN1139_c0_g1_i3.p1  ORF type:complete len:226 (+),score=48.98 TRINITY_DN1139_c0_g1_i3:67-744(+)